VLIWTPDDPGQYQPGLCEVTLASGLVDLAGHPIHGPPAPLVFDRRGEGDIVWARPDDAPVLSASQLGNDRFLHGRPLLPSLGLYDHRARFFDTLTQTFLQPDPLGPIDSPNLYQAFGLDPQNNTDPMGLRKRTEFDQRIRRRLEGRIQQIEQQWVETGTASAVLIDTEARPRCLLCTSNEFVPVARERSASTEKEYQELRARLVEELADFDAAVAKADRDDVIHFRGGGLHGEGPYYTVFTKIDAVAQAEALAWFGVAAAPQVAANVAYMTKLPQARRPIVVEPVGVPGSVVGPGERASYGELKARKRAFGETEPLHMDHQPSFAAQVRAREALLGRPLTKSELAALKRSTPASASPQAVHQETSLTYGGRNTPERIAEDAADLAAAAARDREVFEQAMRARAR
jgi:filamentous hemagglutinin